ncbi:hypothetical protein [Mangrovibacterium sp.]|uniref:hypothetical protein n=1 Tax=Mangrovibacterium sp. TaxID=1961364 RepID=UPI00356276B7
MRYGTGLWGNVKLRNGREVELRENAGWIEWHYVGDSNWNQLFEIPSDGQDGADGQNGTDGTDGQDGADGREVELQENNGWVEWRYVGDTTWNQLFEVPESSGGGTKPIQVTGLTLLAANWVADGDLFKYELANSNITATSSVEVIPDNSAYDVLVEAEPLPETESATGSVTMWVHSVPSADITVTINIVEVQ